jgi:hypothetical protein
MVVVSSFLNGPRGMTNGVEKEKPPVIPLHHQAHRQREEEA